MDPFTSYRFKKGASLRIRALSPNHGGELAPEYYDLLIERALRYGYNQIHVAADNDLDQFIHFRAYPGLERRMGEDRSGVEGRVQLFREFTAKAGKSGLETYVWHHELRFPAALADLHPEGFIPGKTHDFAGDAKLPSPDLDKPVIWNYISARLEEAYAALPDLSGIILTMQESHIPVYHLAEDQAGRVKNIRRLLGHVGREHRRLGRKWILRTFAWREWEYAAILEALQDFDPEVPVETKIVPMDWHLFYPYDRLLTALHGRRHIVEMDLGGNFWGDCEIPAVSCRHYADEVRFAAEQGCEGVVLRTDRGGGHTFDKPMEAHVHVVAGLAKDLCADVPALEKEWLDKTYGGRHAATVKAILDLGFEVVKRTYFQDGSFFFHHRYWNNLRGFCDLWVAERDLVFEPGDERFRLELNLAEDCLKRAEALLQVLLSSAGEKIPPALPETLRYVVHVPHSPLAELSRQVRNLRLRFEFMTALKEAVYAIKCRTYERTEAARARTETAIERVEQALKAAPCMAENQPRYIEDLKAAAAAMPGREIAAARHFSCGESFHGRSYAIPYPEPLRARLTARPGQQNILVLLLGTHTCREVVVDVETGGRTFELRRGTMSWFWAYDGYKRGEIRLPAECVRGEEIEVCVRARNPEQAPFLSEIRMEIVLHG